MIRLLPVLFLLAASAHASPAVHHVLSTGTPPVHVEIRLTEWLGPDLPLFELIFSVPVTSDSVQQSVRLKTGNRSSRVEVHPDDTFDSPPSAHTRWRFTPFFPLAPDTGYDVLLHPATPDPIREDRRAGRADPPSLFRHPSRIPARCHRISIDEIRRAPDSGKHPPSDTSGSRRRFPPLFLRSARSRQSERLHPIPLAHGLPSSSGRTPRPPPQEIPP